MADSNEIKKDEVTKQTPATPKKSDKELAETELDKAAGGGGGGGPWGGRP